MVRTVSKLSHYPPIWMQHLHFDLDSHLNPYVPPAMSAILPRALSYFLGFRGDDNTALPPEIGSIAIAITGAISTFAGLTVIAALFKFSPQLADVHPPVLIGSLAASAILLFTSVSSPLAQPRPAILGHVLSAVIGVALAKNTSYAYTWLIAPLACSVSAALMTLTGTVHPPGGAAAVLAIVDPTARGMGWHFVALIGLAMILMSTVASLFANACGRRYPVWWWSPKETGSWWRSRMKKYTPRDVEKQEDERVKSSSDGANALAAPFLSQETDPERAVVISTRGAFVGRHVNISPEEWACLERIVANVKATEGRTNSEVSAISTESFKSEAACQVESSSRLAR